MKKKLISILTVVTFSTLAYANPHTAYQTGYRNAFQYWKNDERVLKSLTTEELAETAQVRAYRNDYQKPSPDRDAFIKGWLDGCMAILHHKGD
jgi:hypothetical protein